MQFQPRGSVKPPSTKLRAPAQQLFRKTAGARSSVRSTTWASNFSFSLLSHHLFSSARHRERFRKAKGAVAFLRAMADDEPAATPAAPRAPSPPRRLVPRRRAVAPAASTPIVTVKSRTLSPP